MPGRAKTHYDSPDANNSERAVRVVAVREAIIQAHDPSAESVGNGRPEAVGIKISNPTRPSLGVNPIIKSGTPTWLAIELAVG
jgi:hypothetical protein